MASKTGKTRPCNYCVVKRKVLLDCSLFSCLLGEAKARCVRENHTLLVTGAAGLLPHAHAGSTVRGKWKLFDPCSLYHDVMSL